MGDEGCLDLFTVQVLQTVLALRGSHGVAKEGAMVGLWIRPRTPPLIFVAIYTTS